MEKGNPTPKKGVKGQRRVKGLKTPTNKKGRKNLLQGGPKTMKNQKRNQSEEGIKELETEG